MSNTRVLFRPIEGTEVIEGNNRSVKVEKVLQGKKWWMFRWHDCYTKVDEKGMEYLPIKSGYFIDTDEWKALLEKEKYIWLFYPYFIIKL